MLPPRCCCRQRRRWSSAERPECPSSRWISRPPSLAARGSRPGYDRGPHRPWRRASRSRELLLFPGGTTMTRGLRLARLAMVVMLLGGVGGGAFGAALAQDGKLAVAKDDSIRSLLTRHIGKAVALRLDSGEEIVGTVALVGDRVVHLEKLSGREFYDAVVDLEEVAAVVVRVR